MFGMKSGYDLGVSVVESSIRDQQGAPEVSKLNVSSFFCLFEFLKEF